ncbi:hypothetical protein [Neorhodopirellula lusitana]|uniref:hypothetical protein n=1 Tax=Neorhodopirellula lusitana TaxID=445327 RepID=UPI0038502049
MGYINRLVLTFGLLSTLFVFAGCGKPQNRQSSAGMTEEEMEDEFEAINAANEAASKDMTIPE